MKNILDEFADTFTKVRGFFTIKLEKNWKRVNEKVALIKLPSEDFRCLHSFFHSLVNDSLKVHFKVNTLNLLTTSEDH